MHPAALCNREHVIPAEGMFELGERAGIYRI
jgi:hypothetical protein